MALGNPGPNKHLHTLENGWLSDEAVTGWMLGVLESYWSKGDWRNSYAQEPMYYVYIWNKMLVYIFNQDIDVSTQ